MQRASERGAGDQDKSNTSFQLSKIILAEVKYHNAS